MGPKKNLPEAEGDQIEGRIVLTKFIFFPFIASLDYFKELSAYLILAELCFKSSWIKSPG